MTFCSKCGNEETSDKGFCSKCGTKLTIAENDTPRSSERKQGGIKLDKLSPLRKMFIVLPIVLIGIAFLVVTDSPTTKENLKQQTDAFLIAKMELDNYLQSLDKATFECNKIPNSVSIKGLVMDEASKIVTDAALMILIIDEAPIDSGLLPYKQRLIAAIDGLTECINRH